MSSTANRPSRHRRRRPSLRLSALVSVLVVTLGGLAVATDALGAGRLFDRAVAKIDRMIAGPVPDRATVDTVPVTPRPVVTPSPSLAATAAPASTDEASGSVPSSAAPDPTPEPTPARVPVDLDIAADPAGI